MRRDRAYTQGVWQGEARGLGVGQGETQTQGSGEVESVASGSDKVEIVAMGSGEVELAHLGVGWSCSYALDYLDESMLMTISSSSLSTLVLVPDT